MTRNLSVTNLAYGGRWEVQVHVRVRACQQGSSQLENLLSSQEVVSLSQQVSSSNKILSGCNQQLSITWSHQVGLVLKQTNFVDQFI